MSRKHLIKMLFHISRVLVTFIFLFLHFEVATAEERPEKESQISRLVDNMVFQSGGDLGFIALGVGKDFGRHKIDMLIGYVPEDIGGVEIWQVDFKYGWHPSQTITFGTKKNIRLDPFYIGISVIYGTHDDLFVNEPAQYPNGYYPPTALRYTLNIGASLQHRKHTFFLEFTASDVSLIAYIKNPEFFIDNYDYLGLEGIGSLAVGVKFEFE